MTLNLCSVSITNITIIFQCTKFQEIELHEMFEQVVEYTPATGDDEAGAFAVDGTDDGAGNLVKGHHPK